MEDGVIHGCLDPYSGEQNVRIVVCGKRLANVAASKRDVRLFGERLKSTLLRPELVLRMTNGDLLYCATFPNRDTEVFTVRVRPTGMRAYFFDFEMAEYQGSPEPLAQSDDRVEETIYERRKDERTDPFRSTDQRN